MANFDGKARHPVSGLTVDVLGGRFSVTELLLENDQPPEVVIETIQKTNSDRWFVIVSEEADSSEDVLAVISDDFEFNSIALGTLVNES